MAKFYIPNDDLKETSMILSELQSVARQSRTHMARHLADIGLYAGQEQIINLIGQNKNMSSGEIATALGVRPPTITKSIARLKEQGFVERTTGHADGRVVRVSLTKAGKKAFKKLTAATHKAEKQALKNMLPKQQKQLRKALRVISENLATRDAKSRLKKSKR